MLVVQITVCGLAVLVWCVGAPLRLVPFCFRSSVVPLVCVAIDRRSKPKAYVLLTIVQVRVEKKELQRWLMEAGPPAENRARRKRL